MANRVVIKISGEELVLLTDDAPEYVRKVGAYVNDQMRNVVKAAKVGQTRAAIMAAVNIADELYKIREQDEQLRNQIKHYLEESSRQKGEISDLKREVLRLQKAQKKMEQESGGAKEKPTRTSRAKTTRTRTVKPPEPVVEKEEPETATGISSKTARVTALLDSLVEPSADNAAEDAAPAVENVTPAVAEAAVESVPASTEAAPVEIPSVETAPVEPAAPVENALPVETAPAEEPASPVDAPSAPEAEEETFPSLLEEA